MLATGGALVDVLSQIEILRRALRIEWPEKQEFISVESLETIEKMASKWFSFFKTHGFDDLLDDCRQLVQIGQSLTLWKPEQVLERLDVLESAFRTSVGERLVYVTEPGAHQFLAPNVFGEDVKQAFPSAYAEIEAGCQCYALGQPTACVFHMMRAVEHLLRLLVVALGVTPSPKAVPLEYQEWHNLIDQIESAVNSMKSWKKGPIKSRALSTLRPTVVDLNSFKDSIRNDVMHTRSGLLSSPNALGVIRRVFDCFARMTPYLSEDRSVSLLEEAAWLAKTGSEGE